MKENFLWEFDLNNNRYKIVVYNSITTNTLDTMLLPIVYAKWLHLTIVKGPEGFKLLLYGDQVMMETANQIIENNVQNHLYFFHDPEYESNNFNGLVSGLQIFTKAISLYTINSIYKDGKILNDHKNSLSRFGNNNLALLDISKRLFPSKKFSQIEDIAIEQKRQGLGPFYNLNLLSLSQFPFFSGKSYIKFKHGIFRNTKFVGISLWFKFIKIKNSSLTQTLAILKNYLKIQYIQNTEWLNYNNASSQIILYQLTTRTSVSVTVPHQSGEWLHVIATTNSSTGEIVLQVIGYSTASVVTSLTFPDITTYSLILGYDIDGSMFSGMMRELCLFTKSSKEILFPLFNLPKQNLFYAQLVYFQFLNPFLESATAFQTRHFNFDANVKWKSDPENQILCPANMIPEFDFPNHKVLCRESYIVLINLNHNLPALAWKLFD